MFVYIRRIVLCYITVFWVCFKINILYVVSENAAEERPELARDIDVASCNITATPSIGAVSWMRGA